MRLAGYQWGIAALLACVILAALLFGPHSALSQQNDDTVITGYAWSDTIGWVDLNCANTNSCGVHNFGLAVAQNGDISGYAWSDNIGWISANDSDLNGCPSGACKARLSGGNLQGWLKVLAGGTSQSGGWDGWISLKGSSPSYGPTLSNGNFSGYAWGDTNVGWVDFSLARTMYSTSCTPVYSCTDSTTLHSTCPLPSGTDTTCASGQVCSGTSCQDTYSCLNTHTIVNDHTGATTNCPAPLICSSGSPSCVTAPAIQVIDPFEARPSLILEGDTTFLFWNLANANASTCSVTDPGGAVVSQGAASSGADGVETGYIESQTVFTLRCTGEDGQLFTATATVNVIPLWVEI